MNDLRKAPLFASLNDVINDAVAFLQSDPLLLVTTADLTSVLALGFLESALAENDLGGSYPEDLMNLMRQAVAIIDHLTTNHRDIHNKRSLELTEAKIRRLGNYYKAEGKLSADWKYKRDQLRLIVE